jgi:hypothetical protein
MTQKQYFTGYYGIPPFWDIEYFRFHLVSFILCIIQIVFISVKTAKFSGK